MFNILYFLAFLLILVGIDLIYIFKVNTFKINIFLHLISILFPSLCLIYTNFYTVEFLLFLACFEILLILSFTDVKYYEIDKNSYWVLMILCAIKILFFTTSITDSILSPIIVYFIFWLFDKFFGIEKLGGADVKLILIFSFYFPANEVFSFVMYTFLISIILFIILAITKRGFKKIEVPMIVAICLSFFIQRAFLL